LVTQKELRPERASRVTEKERGPMRNENRCTRAARDYSHLPRAGHHQTQEAKSVCHFVIRNTASTL
jgi:hypothetical protein